LPCFQITEVKLTTILNSIKYCTFTSTTEVASNQQYASGSSQFLSCSTAAAPGPANQTTQVILPVSHYNPTQSTISDIAAQQSYYPVQQQQQYGGGSFLQKGPTSLFLWSKDPSVSFDKQKEIVEEAGNLVTSHYGAVIWQGFQFEIEGFERFTLYIRMGWRFKNQTLLKNMGKLR
jgi:hypothetical protein